MGFLGKFGALTIPLPFGLSPERKGYTKCNLEEFFGKLRRIKRFPPKLQTLGTSFLTFGPISTLNLNLLGSFKRG